MIINYKAGILPPASSRARQPYLGHRRRVMHRDRPFQALLATSATPRAARRPALPEPSVALRIK